MNDEIVRELSKKYNKKESCIKIMIYKCIGLGYNFKEFEILLQEFLKN